MTDKTIGELITQLETGKFSGNQQNLPVMAQLEVTPVIEYTPIKPTRESDVKSDPLVARSASYFTRLEKTKKSTFSTIGKETTATLISENRSQSESLASPSDYSPILDKMDEIKEVLESNQNEDLKLFKREQRLEQRRSRQLIRVTKRSGKGGSADGNIGKAFGSGLRGVIKVLPKLGAGLSTFGSVVVGLAAPLAGVVSAIGGVAMIGKDVFKIFKSWKKGGWKEVKGEDTGGVAGGVGGAAIGGAIGTAILPGVGTLLGAGIGMITGNLLGEKTGQALEESPKEKTARIEKAKREEQARNAQKAKEIADRARQSRKNEDGFDYADRWRKKKPSAATANTAEKSVQSTELIKDRCELVTAKTVQATKEQKILTTSRVPSIKQQAINIDQVKAAAMKKMNAHIQGSDAKKQLDALIAEFKGLRKDMKRQLDTPEEIQNPMLRETIIQSKNLFR